MVMNALISTSWGRRGAYLLVLAGGLLLVVWAPVPAAYQLAFRAVILGGLYIAMVARLWREAVETLDCDDQHLSPYCQEQLRRYLEQHAPVPRTVPLTPVQRRYLSSLSPHEERQEEHRD
jgi:hypothetical protein